MSLAEIKNEIVSLSPEEQEELRRFMIIQRMRNDPKWKEEMERRIDEVRAGNYYTKEDLDRIHAARIGQQ
jgi:microcompartment protein CcmK/EutM